jgi:hypothetical protein
MVRLPGDNRHHRPGRVLSLKQRSRKLSAREAEFTTNSASLPLEFKSFLRACLQSCGRFDGLPDELSDPQLARGASNSFRQEINSVPHFSASAQNTLPCRDRPPGMRYRLEIVAVVPSNLVKCTVNFSL